ncbi:hypothetical protein C4571_02305 [Candidatus Parcubacteria bacterium]|nr:MAG: hypothetical protein C4571_02305 [Candidatus Parcubacteria bacterium]
MNNTISNGERLKSSPRDVFMYLFATITLYFSVWSIINLLHQHINVLFPDPLNPYFEPGSSMRWSMALLITIFPAYLWVSRFLHRDLLVNPEKIEIRVRRWLMYLTLFLAALLVIGDLVALIYSFLEGEITTRFVLKVLSVLVVAGAVFWYYLYDLRAKASPLSGRALLFVRGAIIFVALAVIAGLFVAGSPFKQRLLRFDRQKVNDLQNIQWQAVNYWQKKQALPPDLEALRDDISGYAVPRDPQTGAGYEYRTTGDRTFELCAEFNLPSSGGTTFYARPYPIPELPQGESWDHKEGRTCFERTIDPDLYPPQKPVPMVR